jgi:hypothetical protein
MQLHIQGIDSNWVQNIQSGGADANGQPARVEIAEGTGNPCRHCLQQVAEGDELMIMSFSPFAELQPYAERGPIFLHRDNCERYDSVDMPDWFDFIDPAMVRGYDENDWICYDTGQIVAGPDLRQTCESILQDPAICYVHIRSRFGCFQCEVRRV